MDKRLGMGGFGFYGFSNFVFVVFIVVCVFTALGFVVKDFWFSCVEGRG